MMLLLFGEDEPAKEGEGGLKLLVEAKHRHHGAYGLDSYGNSTSHHISPQLLGRFQVFGWTI